MKVMNGEQGQKAFDLQIQARESPSLGVCISDDIWKSSDAHGEERVSQSL
jgi:hypothetical protein